MTSLMAALGSPRADSTVPGARFPGWTAARASLASALAGLGVTARLRSWQALWRLLHDPPPPRTATWAALCGSATVANVAGKIRTLQTQDLVRVISWNARWLVDPLAPVGQRKRQLSDSWLLRGSLVLLQETHWTPETAAIWEAISHTAPSPLHRPLWDRGAVHREALPS